WAATQAQDVFNAIVKNMEDIGESIKSMVEWAESAGTWALEKIGNAIVTLGNSVDYLLNYLEKDFIPGIARAVKGMLAAGAALADLVTWMAKRSIVIVQEVV